ncbi:MAG: YkvA family protein [Nitrolancea sp.]
MAMRDERSSSDAMRRGMLARWKDQARRLKQEGHALYLAYRDPRVPWYARLFAAIALGYLFSPIDLIPDFIPVVGYLDDLLLVPLFILIARRLIPADVLAEHREIARTQSETGKPVNWVAAVAIILIWSAMAVLAGLLLWRAVR